MEFAKRIESLSRNVFADMDRAKGEAKAVGKEIIDLSLGSCDLPAAPHTLEAIANSFTGCQYSWLLTAQWYKAI